MATKGRITGIKRSSETIKTAVGTLATHVEASADGGLEIFGYVRDSKVEAAIAAEVGIKVNGKVVAVLTLSMAGDLDVEDFTGFLRKTVKRNG